jgi:hypothetical protein
MTLAGNALPEHCNNLISHRQQGSYWENAFIDMAASHEKLTIPLQLGKENSAVGYVKDKTIILPDVLVASSNEYHEIKHKNPTRLGSYGLEKYRFDSFLFLANKIDGRVMYTIHDHDLAGGRHVVENYIGDWLTIDVTELAGKEVYEGLGYSYVNGSKTKVTMLYWDKELWVSLCAYWGVVVV